ncbi:MAG: hypothetical protein HC900_12800 [Methylacidiphilales bacterium]|nr:hypothetical protein [Candidatus Methylacidiphilales bacterium]
MAQKRARGIAMDIDPEHVPPALPRLDRNAQARLGEQLRAMYDDLLQQPIPDRFVELLKNLDDVEKGKTAEKGTAG